MAENKDPDDRHEAALESLELTEVLVGKKHMSDQDFLERMAHGDRLVYGDPGGPCAQKTLDSGAIPRKNAPSR